MARNDDDSGWESDPLIRALRAPGTADELARQDEFTAAFRAEQPRGNVRRMVGRFGIGATTAVTTIALSAGVAAAYGRVLPDPVQRLAHTVLGNVGVPAPSVERPEAKHPVPSKTATAEPGTTPSPTPSATPTRGSDPKPPSLTTSAKPGQVGDPQPSSTPTPTPTPTPTSTPPAAKVPASLVASTPETRVVAGNSVAVAGVVAASDGTPLKGRVVRLLTKTRGAWTKVASARTDRNGQVTLLTPSLTRNTGLRLSTTHHVHSTLIAVVVVPVLNATVAEASGTSTLTVSVLGGQSGDHLTAFRRQGEKLVKVGSVELDANGTASLSLPTPKRAVRLILRLPASKQHAKVQSSVTIGKKAI